MATQILVRKRPAIVKSTNRRNPEVCRFLHSHPRTGDLGCLNRKAHGFPKACKSHTSTLRPPASHDRLDFCLWRRVHWLTLHTAAGKGSRSWVHKTSVTLAVLLVVMWPQDQKAWCAEQTKTPGMQVLVTWRGAIASAGMEDGWSKQRTERNRRVGQGLGRGEDVQVRSSNRYIQGCVFG